MTSSVEQCRDEAATAVLPVTTGVLALLYAALAVVDPLVLDGAPAVVMTALGAASCVVLGTTALLTRSRPVPHRAGHPAIAAVVVLVAVDSLVRLLMTGQPQQTTNVMLTVVGAGAGLLSVRWLTATLVGLWLAWLGAVAVVGAAPAGTQRTWTHYALGMASATVLAYVVNAARRQSVAAVVEARALAEAAAAQDPLTGLANRRGLGMLGAQIVATSRRQGDAVHCTLLDVDGIAGVYAQHGPGVGDRVLVAVADVLRGSTRATDAVARWGDLVFCVVGPGPGIAPLELERRVRDRLIADPPVPVEVWVPSVVAGGAMLAPWDGGSLDTLLGNADQEMRLRRSSRRDRRRGPTAGAPKPG